MKTTSLPIFAVLALLALLSSSAIAADAMTYTWTDGSAHPDEAFKLCHKVTRVFWNYFCVSKKGWETTDAAAKIDVMIRTFAEYIDSDLDCVPDDS